MYVEEMNEILDLTLGEYLILRQVISQGDCNLDGSDIKGYLGNYFSQKAFDNLKYNDVLIQSSVDKTKAYAPYFNGFW